MRLKLSSAQDQSRLRELHLESKQDWASVQVISTLSKSAHLTLVDAGLAALKLSRQLRELNHRLAQGFQPNAHRAQTAEELMHKVTLTDVITWRRGRRRASERSGTRFSVTS